MNCRVDLSGNKYGRLTVLSFSHTKNRILYWKCLCDCGNEKIVSGISLKSGRTKSCGCFNKNVKSYPSYGGRGITICEAWLKDVTAFLNWAMTNGYDDTKSIDRIDVNGNYSPENCRWVTQKEQSRNTRQNHYVTIGNQTMCLSDWTRQSGISAQTAIKRLGRGWTIEEAVGLTQRHKEAI